MEHVARKYWNHFRGKDQVKHYSSHERYASLATDTDGKWLCLSALAALLDYAEFIEKVRQYYFGCKHRHLCAKNLLCRSPSSRARSVSRTPRRSAPCSSTRPPCATSS